MASSAKILLIGNTGQLGWELERTLGPLGDVVAIDYPEVDLAKPDQVRAAVRDARPTLIVNAAAYTDVDKAEAEPQLAMAINGEAPGLLAEEARWLRSVLVHYSTDYVFDGTKGKPYVETDAPNPINQYGASKLAGEKAISAVGGAWLILRTSWVYSLRRDNFVTRVLSWARQRESLRIVSDQVGSPTWARMLAETTAQALAGSGVTTGEWAQEHGGLYHLAGAGAVSRHDFARAILALDARSSEHVTREVQAASSAEFPTDARRPLYSVLDSRRFADAFQVKVQDWRSSLELALAEA